MNGDVTHTSKLSELSGLRECAHQVGINKFFIVNGNHDVWRLSRKMVASYSCNPRPGYFAFEVDLPHSGSKAATCHFIILDTTRKRPRADTRGHVGKTQLNWLNNQITHASPGPLFILAHHPLPELVTTKRLPGFHISNSDEVWEILKERKATPAFYFCGHTHEHNIVRHENWLLVEHDSPLNCLNFPVIEVDRQKVQMRFLPIEGGTETAWMNRMLSLGQYRLINFVRDSDRDIYHKEIVFEWN
jgi:3',5'-cyclic AMP phosphodiesterase CpdA